MKRLLFTMMLLLLAGVFAAAQAETLGAVGAAAQTADETLSVADIYERASGSVVQVRGMAETWSRETGVSVETLRQSFTDTLQALDDISTYKQEALPRIRKTIDDFYALAEAGEEHLRRIEGASS